MHDFDFVEPASVQEACQLLAQHGDDCRVVAGGSAVVLVMRQRMIAPTHLISLAKLTPLKTISADSQGWLRIGALNRHTDVATSPLVRTHWPMLASMASKVANPQVRHQGTIGGNLCYGDPATDPPSCLMALDAQVVLVSPRGERVITMEEFLVDYYTTALEPDEILTEILVPPLPAGTQGVYTRHLRSAAEHRPMLNVAVSVQVQGGICMHVRVVIGASTPVPTRMRRAEALLHGQAVTSALIEQAAQLASEDMNPISDARGEGEYRRTVARAVARRTMNQAFGFAQE